MENASKKFQKTQRLLGGAAGRRYTDAWEGMVVYGECRRSGGPDLEILGIGGEMCQRTGNAQIEQKITERKKKKNGY